MPSCKFISINSTRHCWALLVWNVSFRPFKENTLSSPGVGSIWTSSVCICHLHRGWSPLSHVFPFCTHSFPAFSVPYRNYWIPLVQLLWNKSDFVAAPPLKPQSDSPFILEIFSQFFWECQCYEPICGICTPFSILSEWRCSIVSDCNPMDCNLPCSSVRGIFQARVLEWVCHFLLQRIFPTQGSNPGLPHCKQDQLSHQGSPKTRKTRTKTKTKITP